MTCQELAARTKDEDYILTVKVIDALAGKIARRLMSCGQDVGAQASVLQMVGPKAYDCEWSCAAGFVAHVRKSCHQCRVNHDCFAPTFLDHLQFEIDQVMRSGE